MSGVDAHTISAPAKVNLTLKVHGRRLDGYHALTSIVAFASDVADSVTLEAAGNNDVCFRGQYASGIEVGNDTVTKTVALLARQLPQIGSLRVAVDKQIPLASGLGGGSADAAAVMRGLKVVKPKVADDIDWFAVARQIGADVPVCLQSTAQIMTGQGDCVRRISGFPELFAVLINAGAPPIPDKTKHVFDALSAQELADEDQSGPAVPVPTFSDIAQVVQAVRSTGNDLLNPAMAVSSSIERPLAALASQLCCLASSLTGAGPTVFGLFETLAQANTALDTIKQAEPGWWVRATRLI